MKISDAFARPKAAPSPAVLVGFAAIGMAAGLAANFGRKLLVQGPSLLRRDWQKALQTEHRTVFRLLDALEATEETQKAKRSMLLTQIKHLLGKHAFEEENVIYPAMRDHGLAEEAEQLITDHGDVKHALFELEMMAPNAPRFLSKVGELRSALETHIAEEEETLFPALAAALSDADGARLTASMNKEGLKLA
ncbi:hemerythrin domain-containing protein [Sphingobium lignivorans]|uniref:Iron-sulfur cluster repair protein YtfE (RIC family) n=1 Tax=Sphingobium lignivorans TaxID=2735886 RepID=A0ABR6ND86_9SPHN|nr:hemerythrin domain-containing protein [Sphingobium lignivorans]MBB5985041.1 iron-sulfur cluster repair protein YtfE (RIC family) [Sphingobium lignivorans]